ncbi:FAD-dependent oxidoreductase [Bradyrhizobium sp. LTSPM299]|uniref:NAD(P)/FAD-dependent oxidoreductase n=1 Tax=Bradyrhizobium sp. LTSPM299 TaxID=1619233 RepID=UPI0005C9BE9E|nr:FAD-binding oxidoreductase [Bradyrhizobium sp. LTSPM299]KJC55639.1 FAD-dependent oxidoreductase [Bradyrhizobium sp. LTSPM299]
MTETSTSAADGPGDAASPFRNRLAFDLDVDICVVGAGVAGLTVAREAARLGASVAVLEGRHVGWNASGHNLGTVMPGFGVPVSDLIERVGLDDARELWALAKEGVDYVRATATEDLIPGIATSEGALEVSNVDAGETLIRRLQTLAEDFATEVEGWQVDRVRSVLGTGRYFHGIHYPKAFQLDGRKYVHGLAALATRMGARIFEDTPVVSIDFSGIRKRIVTPSARLRASHIVLAGNVHLGAPLKRLSETLLPVWRYAALTEPLGERLAEIISFHGSVTDSDGIDHFRLVDGDRLLWSSPETTWEARPGRFGAAVRRRIATVFPQLGKVPIADVFGGAVGVTVHGMPQIGQLRRGLWVASGFGRQGLNTSAMAGQLIARSILWGDDRWRLFSPFELVWAGGTTGRVAGHVIGLWARGASSAAGMLARHREGARAKERVREARLAEANFKAGTRGPAPRHPPPGAVRPAPPPAAQEGAEPDPVASQESEGIPGGPM